MKCKCQECELKNECVVYEIIENVGEQNFIDIMKTLRFANIIELPSSSDKKQFQKQRMQKRTQREISAIQFWKNILEEEEDKEMLEIAIDSLQYILDKVGVNVVQDIQTRSEFSHIYEKCKRLKVKYF